MAKEHSHCHVQPERQYSCKRAAGVQPETSGAERIPSWGKGERSNAPGLQDTSGVSAQRATVLLHDAEQTRVISRVPEMGTWPSEQPGLLGTRTQRLTGKTLGFSFLGSEIDCADKYGNTPLHVAARYGHELLISTLMTNGADTAR